jgi:hypothetical protein
MNIQKTRCVCHLLMTTENRVGRLKFGHESTSMLLRMDATLLHDSDSIFQQKWVKNNALELHIHFSELLHGTVLN